MVQKKLVRDKIPEIIRHHGRRPILHTATDCEYKEKLREKLLEEVNEFLRSDEVDELADILEVIYAICDFKKIGLGRLCTFVA